MLDLGTGPTENLHSIRVEGLNGIRNLYLRGAVAVHWVRYQHYSRTSALRHLAVRQDKLEVADMVSDLTRRCIRVRNGGRSLYWQRISPGCIHCAQAKGKSIHFTKRCNRGCFFCFSPDPVNIEPVASYEEKEQELLEAARIVPICSFAVTGGEPLLTPSETLRILERAKRIRCGKVQTRLYTNGDLLDELMIRQLQNVGLDEIRFGLKPDQIDLSKLILACGKIPRVMVEMPVMPDKEEIMLDLLLELNRLEVFGINLLEFVYCGYNADQYAARGYSLRAASLLPYHDEARWQYAVHGSEELCVRLLRFSAERNLSIGVHYCSLANRRLSMLACRRAVARYTKTAYDVITEDGLRVCLAVYPPDQENAMKILRRAGVEESEMHFSDERKRLETSIRYDALLGDIERAFIYTTPYGQTASIVVRHGSSRFDSAIPQEEQQRLSKSVSLLQVLLRTNA
jgi:pyruvate formate-lyase activating enzyme-like uncharacterized protein